MNKAIDDYFNFLLSAFQYDIEVFSKPWIYICLLIPAIFYLMFFIMKWWVLLFPIWFPLRLILSPFYPKRKRKKTKIQNKVLGFKNNINNGES
jgi:hypothetical protein